jgi:hypothetical protein
MLIAEIRFRNADHAERLGAALTIVCQPERSPV